MYQQSRPSIKVSIDPISLQGPFPNVININEFTTEHTIAI